MSKISKRARDEQCFIRIPKVCNRDRTTTVLCHDPNGSGWAGKYPDSEAAFGCSACHDVVDGRVPAPDLWSRHDILLAFYQGARRTRILLVEEGLIKLS
jgi:hypothetical protein